MVTRLIYLYICNDTPAAGVRGERRLRGLGLCVLPFDQPTPRRVRSCREFTKFLKNPKEEAVRSLDHLYFDAVHSK